MNSRIKEDVQKIFEFWCEVANITNDSSNNKKCNNKTGIIIESFPKSYHDEQIITKIPDFAYPCEFENDSVQTYSFVLTSDDSKWRFGFCRHDPKTQTAMVIITYLPWHDTFLKLLSVLGELRRNNGEFESFLSEAYNKNVPELGASLKLFYNCGQNHFIFQRPSQFELPSIPENHNLNLYYNFVEPKNMISVFAAMLAERRIIFTSRRFDKLSSCIQAANAFLYPMVWQHIFIPVLPMKMKDILSAPMPYLIGVPEAVLQTMTPEELGDVVILNCDNGIFQSPFDDVKPMPSEIVSQMKKQLSNSHDHIGDRVSKIFLCVLVQLIGGYRDAVQFTQGQKITWDRDTFVESRPPHLRPFLTKMMELQIFQQFIEERLEMLNTGLGFSDEFELETLRYSEKIGRKGKHYKEFLRNVKEKTNPAVKSAVKSVKEGSRGVKTAYKDLKSKLRDITPPKSSQFQSHIPSFTSTSQSSSKHGVMMISDGGGIGGLSTGENGFNNIDGGNSSRIQKQQQQQQQKQQQQQHRSAPNSPVFSKRSLTSNFGNGDNNDDNVIKNLPRSMIINRQQQNKPGPLQTSNSQILNGFKLYHNNSFMKNNLNIDTHTTTNNNNINYNSSSNNNQYQQQHQQQQQQQQHHYLSKSPTISPSSSLCSSDMNISQELQNHPLFKSPIVDRSEYKNQKIDDTTKDLISLDDSNNTSFDLEDFDPLNQNAKPFPPILGLSEKHHNNSFNLPSTSSLSSSSGIIASSVGSVDVTEASSSTSSSSFVHNPLYPYFSPQHRHHQTTLKQKQIPVNVIESTKNNKDDDFELLRKYGLDQFTLTNGSDLTSTKKVLNKSDWMVFD